MKIKIIISVFLIFSFSIVFGNEIPYDSLYKKAQTEIYNNSEIALKIARKLLEKERDPNKKIDLYLLISKAFIAERNLEESLKYVTKAKELLNGNVTQEARIKVQISIAIQYQQMELYRQSLEILDKTEHDITKSFSNNPNRYIYIGKINAIRGMIEKKISNFEFALENLRTSVKNFEKAKPSDEIFSNMSIDYYNIAYCYVYLDQVHKANLYFLKSVEFAKKANAKVLEAFALKGFADIYATKGKYSESLKLFEEAKNLSERTGDLILKERIYKGMCDNYLALQNVQEYQIYNQKYLETKFKREQNQLNSISQTINNQRIEKNKQIELIKLKYQNLNIFLILFSLILCFGFLYLTIKKRNANAVLKKKVL